MKLINLKDQANYSNLEKVCIFERATYWYKVNYRYLKKSVYLIQ